MSKKNKINILDESAIRDCTGCSACSLVCHSSAISMHLKQNGFYEPTIASDLCTMCGVCPDVCYKFDEFNIINPFEESQVIAVTNNFIDDMNSVSTVGVGTRLAEHFFEKGYNVCGVKYDYEKDVAQHDIATSLDDILEFKGSKYLPSDTKVAFEQLVKEKKPSIVFGLPCHIHGLRKVIEKKKISDKFILIDLFCAGVPSQSLWNKHLDYLNRKFSIGKIKSINFRDKTQGWYKSSLNVVDVDGNNYRQNWFNDMYYSFFLKKVALQEACYNCEFRTNVVSSDIRLGDFWGPKYKVWDDGVELMTIMNEQGNFAWKEIEDCFSYQVCEKKDLYESQKSSSMKTSAKKPSNYEGIVNSLSSDEKLENIFKEFKIAKLPFGGV